MTIIVAAIIADVGPAITLASIVVALLGTWSLSCSRIHHFDFFWKRSFLVGYLLLRQGDPLSPSSSFMQRMEITMFSS